MKLEQKLIGKVGAIGSVAFGALMTFVVWLSGQNIERSTKAAGAFVLILFSCLLGFVVGCFVASLAIEKMKKEKPEYRKIFESESE